MQCCHITERLHAYLFILYLKKAVVFQALFNHIDELPFCVS